MRDVIIVGGGAAGCVLANRLSEDEGRTVLLLEAGPDYPDLASTPKAMVKSLSGPVFGSDWGYTGSGGQPGHPIPLPRAKAIGGCSSTNATIALRGHPGDYDEWSSLGASGWSFDEVLPYFRKLETDHDYDGAWHGSAGPLPIRRDQPNDLTPVHKAFVEASQALGHGYVGDHNGGASAGVGPFPKNTVDGIRHSAALTYLRAARARKNLEVRGDSLVDRVVFEGDRATAVRLAGTGEEIFANTVILSAGAYASPAILMRSGVGPANHLAEVGIECRHDRPGTGRNLSDHCACWVSFRASSGPTHTNVILQVVLTTTSGLSEYPFDLHLFPRSIALDGANQPEFRITVGLLKPHSRGSVSLRSTDPYTPPLIDMGYYTDQSDLPRMVQGVREARKISTTRPLSGFVEEEIFPGRDVETDDEIAHAIRKATRTYHHPVGTCTMGPAGHPEAVVDNSGKVHGMDGLYVVDASIMPTVPAANTHVPTIMVAERCADRIKEAV